jgi:hypothetical protein
MCMSDARIFSGDLLHHKSPKRTVIKAESGSTRNTKIGVSGRSIV